LYAHIYFVAKSISGLIIDTRATRYVVRDRAGFVDYRKILIGTHVVYIRNGSYEEALGVGSYQLHLRTGHTLLLHDVLYVPGILYNLLSVFTLLQLGYDFHLSWNGLDILLDNVISRHGSICESLFKIDLFESFISSNFVIDCNMTISSFTWHAGKIR
jgi:hypothetical protein